MKLHETVYRPIGFTISYKLIGQKTAFISFNYSTIDLYDQYIFRVRYHGYEEYATSLMKLNHTQENSLTINNMVDAGYIVCVSLFSSIKPCQQPPLSSTGMCIDFTIGKVHPVGSVHSSTTGLLAPLLLTVAASFLIFITIISIFTDAKGIKDINNKRSTDQGNNPKFCSNVDFSIENKKFQSLPSFTLNQSENISFCISDPRNDEIKSEISFVGILEDESTLSSIKTLNHLLNDKPWLSSSQSIYKKNFNLSKF